MVPNRKGATPGVYKTSNTKKALPEKKVLKESKPRNAWEWSPFKLPCKKVLHCYMMPHS